MKNRFICILGLLTFVFMGNVFAEERDFPVSPEVVSGKLREYLIGRSLYPYIEPGPADLLIEGGLEERFEDGLVDCMFLQAKLIQEEKSLLGMFALVVNKETNAVGVKLCYLTNDRLISPILFYDIMVSPQLYSLLPKAYELFEESKIDVFIDQKGGNSLQAWRFFNPDVDFVMDVSLEDDGIGGTYFTLSGRE